MGTNALMLSRWLQSGEEEALKRWNISIQAQGGLWRGSLDLFIDWAEPQTFSDVFHNCYKLGDT